MYEFNFNRPASIADALTAIADADDGQFMAGGQTMIPVLKQRLAMPSDVVELANIDDLKGIAVDGGTVTIGAMTPHSEVHNSLEVADAIPALADLAGMIGDPHVRNRGTIGGNAANGDPGNDMPAVMMALDARYVLHGPDGEREIAARDYYRDVFDTAIAPGDTSKFLVCYTPIPEGTDTCSVSVTTDGGNGAVAVQVSRSPTRPSRGVTATVATVGAVLVTVAEAVAVAVPPSPSLAVAVQVMALSTASSVVTV